MFGPAEAVVKRVVVGKTGHGAELCVGDHVVSAAFRGSFSFQHIECIADGLDRGEKCRERIEGNIEAEMLKILGRQGRRLVSVNDADNLGAAHSLRNGLDLCDLLDPVDKDEIRAGILIKVGAANSFVNAFALNCIGPGNDHQRVRTPCRNGAA